MGLRDWFGRLIQRDTPDEAPDPDELAADGPTSTPSASGARPHDPLAALRGLTVAAGVTRVMELLESAPTASDAGVLLRWLRGAVSDAGLAPELRARMSDFFADRGEVAVAAAVLRPLVERGDMLAPPALMRLSEFARQRGDVAEATQCYEEVLAIDVDYPGARDRLARLRAPARAGAAGATLLSPEAAQLAQGRFALVRELGRGGAGAVFLSRDTRVGREVALKIYHPTRRTDRGVRLRAEARVAAALASRHIVRVYDLFEDLGGVSMEHCSGGSLSTAVARDEVPAATRRSWLHAVAHALAVAHDRGWLHRDLKPGNVLLRGDGVPALTDFGLACRVGSTIEPYEGTPGYVAPEVRSRAVADPRIDVFAFGALARSLLGDDDAVLRDVVRAAHATDPDVRPRDGAVLLRAVASAGVRSA